MKVSIRLAAFGSSQVFGSKSRTSPAMCVVYAVASKWVIVPMPDLPVVTASQADSRELPTGETMPMPVTTTRRLLIWVISRTGIDGTADHAVQSETHEAAQCAAPLKGFRGL